MQKRDLELLNERKVGIVGCGHLGQSIAQSLCGQGLEKENLFISYRGNPLTYQKLEIKGLSSCLAENQRLIKEAGIVLITVRPQDITGLDELLAVNHKGLIVSCMAGVPLKLLNQIFKTEVYRMMFSGPDTILSRNGVAAVYPRHEDLELLIGLLNLKYIKIGKEDDLDVFTAGVCMPAAILRVEDLNECVSAIRRIKSEFPLLSELYGWAVKALPDFQNSAEKDAYIQRMITKGGITEAIINGLQRGESLDTSMQKGISRIKEITVEIQKSILSSENKEKTVAAR